MKPRVSVILPIYNSAKYLSRALDSVVDQTYADWELLAVNDCGSDDGSAEIVRVYEQKDPRIRLVQNEERLGLAESLNRGFRMARGEYLARLDADDIAHPERFAKQVAFLDAHPEVGVCGTYQHRFGQNSDWTHKPPVRPEDMKAALVFHCNICHSTLMLRRAVFVDNGLFYDSRFQAEDFELWSRAIMVTDFATIPEVLGEYRKGDNITAGKKAELIAESGQIVAATLKRTLGLELTERQAGYFQGWVNPFLKAEDWAQKERDLRQFEAVLREIYDRNEKAGVFARESLVNAIAVEWNRALYDQSRIWNGDHLYTTIDEVFGQTEAEPVKTGEKRTPGKKPAPGAQGWLKRLLARPAQFARRIHTSLARDSVKKLTARIDRLERRVSELNDAMDKHVDRNTHSLSETIEQTVNKRVTRAETKIGKRVDKGAREGYEQTRAALAWEAERAAVRPEYIPARRGETIRVGILFREPSEWASTESLWQALASDSRFVPRIYVAGTKQRQPAETAAAALLCRQGVPFTELRRYTLLQDKPHALIYQGPVDGEDPDYLRADRVTELGIRVIHIPAEPELTVWALQGDRPGGTGLTCRPWRKLALTEAARFDHICCSPRGGQHVLAAGHPRFDGLARRAEYTLEPELLRQVNGRKLVLMELRTPEKREEASLSEGDIGSYVEFLRGAGAYQEFFFLVRMEPSYPAYYEARQMGPEAAELLRLLAETENVRQLGGEDDYRPALYAAECVIGDRSAVLLEAAALGVPVLYMSNFYYKEPLLPSADEVFGSFYQGAAAYDIRFFLDFVAGRGNDYKREERQRAAEQYLPAPDGNNGRRAAEAIAEAVYGEASEHA